LVAECPAFVNRCPFSETHTQTGGAVRAAKEKCPGFKDECAFKSAGTLEELEQLL
jgi:Fe-S-cluster-containing dehydrogenase component